MSLPSSISLTPEQIANIQYQLQHIHEDRRPQGIPAHVAFVVLATVAVFLRFVSRKVAKLPYKADDYMTLLGLVLLYGLFVTSILAGHYGFGTHVIAISRPNLTRVLKLGYCYQLIYIPALSVFKLSILLLYLRIFKRSRYHVVFYVVGIYVVIWTVGCLIASFLQTQPISYNWNPFQPGTAINRHAFLIANAVTNIIGDVLVLISPIPIVWKLHISMCRKIMVYCVFLLGALVCVVSIVRACMISKILAFDMTWEGYPAGVIYGIEPSVGLVCACLPVMPALLVKIRSKARSKSDSGRSGGFWRSRLSFFSSVRKFSSSEKIASKDSSQPPTPPPECRCRTPPFPMMPNSPHRSVLEFKAAREDDERGGLPTKPFPAVLK